MMRGWFGPKRIGFGASPRGWQGWLVTILFLVALIGGELLLHQTGWGRLHGNRLVFAGVLVVAYLAVIALTYDSKA